MRIESIALAILTLAAGCGTERSTEAFSTGPDGGVPLAPLRIRVEDDPRGAVPVPGAGSRPTVTLVFALDFATGSAGDLAGGNQIAVQAVVDSFATAAVSVPQSLGANAFSAVRVTLVSATVAIPGASGAMDLLGGGAFTRVVSLERSALIAIDLNSARWLTPVTNPLPGQPAFLFNGPTAFLDAIEIIVR